MESPSRPVRLFFTAAALATFSCPALAQQMCGPADQLVASLAKSYGERPVALGISAHGQATIEIYLNPATRTFSIVRRHGNVSCLVADGEDFETLPLDEPDAPPGDPS